MHGCDVSRMRVHQYTLLEPVAGREINALLQDTPSASDQNSKVPMFNMLLSRDPSLPQRPSHSDCH